MLSTANQPDLIISLSRDRVTLELSALPDIGRSYWKTSFDVESIFLKDQISHSIDKVLFDNPVLLDHFNCVEIIVLDRPNVTIPFRYLENGGAVDIASRYLRPRTGDTLNADTLNNDSVFCYTMPTETLKMLKEYYANINVTHLCSVLWKAISAHENFLQEAVTYYTTIGNTLNVLASKNDKLLFSKNFNIQEEEDLVYYVIACSRMLQSNEHWLVTIENKESIFKIPDDTFLKIDNHLSLPSLHTLLAQYKPCGS